jgi:hypothetical protein
MTIFSLPCLDAFFTPQVSVWVWQFGQIIPKLLWRLSWVSPFLWSTCNLNGLLFHRVSWPHS